MILEVQCMYVDRNVLVYVSAGEAGCFREVAA